MAKLEFRGQRVFDLLNNYRFHVIDVTFGAPAVLNVSYGFARVTSPEVSVTMREVKEATLEYKHYVPIAAEVSPITLERGVSIFNSDFSDWIFSVIPGVPLQRRDLLLIQYSDIATGAATEVGLQSGFSNFANNIISFSDLFSRIPAKVWMLHSCLPTSYKAGSDFDALGNEISIAQLTIQPQIVSEISLGLF